MINAEGKKGYPKEKEVEKREDSWVGCNCECEVKRGGKIAPKAVDEDLYKISPHLLHQQPKRKRGWGIFSSCLVPTCVC
ncbi:Unknown protein [Striga hermonthica]|uniref:Uncharacterized protein n=1 Tax=Striga hermonthica TaxID=68872 RepID=A0A9N7MNG2_STRHE|nr:Unknown protein [Striga hermonthica]